MIRFLIIIGDSKKANEANEEGFDVAVIKFGNGGRICKDSEEGA